MNAPNRERNGMQISKRSWHYRLYRYTANVLRGPQYLNPFSKRVTRTEPTLPHSLCPYAWMVLLGSLGTLVILVVATPASLVLAVGWLLCNGAVLLGRGAARLARYLDGVVPRRAARPEKPEKPKKEKKPKRERTPILVPFLKARKERVCPTINLVD